MNASHDRRLTKLEQAKLEQERRPAAFIPSRQVGRFAMWAIEATSEEAILRQDN